MIPAHAFLTRAASALAVALVATGLEAPALRAQDGLQAGCRLAPASAAVRQFCELAAFAAETMEARIGIASTAGNPVPGTASTFGMKLGSLPRMSIGGRISITRFELPAIERINSSATPDGWLFALNADGSVGLFSGFALFPTVGGFMSIDLIGSAGITRIPDSDGVDSGWPFNWALGARLGIMRESFTAPGVSISAAYRGFGGARYGDPAFATADAFIDLDGIHAWSFRGAVGKQLTLLGLTGGIGYDQYSADTALRVNNAGGVTVQISEEGVSTGRFSAFANASLTMLILTLSGELGWQQGGDAPEVPSIGDIPGGGVLFASIALRLAI